MSNGSSPLSYANNKRTHVAIRRLRKLLNILYPDPNLDIFTLDSFEFVYKLQGLNQTAVQHLERSQRIIPALGDFRLNGLNEFHIGLIYLYYGECFAAEKQFDQARRQWSVVHEPAGLSLAYLGCGYAQDLAHHQEAALISYAKAWQGLARLSPLPTANYEQFHTRIERCIRAAQKRLRNDIQPQDWLLVQTRPNVEDIPLIEEQPSQIVYQSESAGTIRLQPHPSEQAERGRRIYLREVMPRTGSFKWDNEAGRVHFTPSPGFVDLPDIIGIVVGLWRPAERAISNGNR